MNQENNDAYAKLIGTNISYYMRKPLIYVGRECKSDNQADLLLPTTTNTISRLHVHIEMKKTQFWLKCYSKCGCFVDGKYVGKDFAPIVLTNRSLIQISNICLYFLLPTSSSLSTTSLLSSNIRSFGRIKWRRGERERLRASLLTFGFGEWKRIRLVVGEYLDIYELENYSLQVVALILKHGEIEEMFGLSGVLANSFANQRNIYIDSIDESVVEWPAVTKNAKPWGRRLLLLYQLRCLYEILGERNMLNGVDTSRVRGRLPATWWTKAHDYDLLLGVLTHGYGCFEEIRDDETYSFLPTLRKLYKQRQEQQQQQQPLDVINDVEMEDVTTTTTARASSPPPQVDDITVEDDDIEEDGEEAVNAGRLSRMILKEKIRTASGCMNNSNTSTDPKFLSFVKSQWPSLLALVGRLRKLTEASILKNKIDVSQVIPQIQEYFKLPDIAHHASTINHHKRQRSDDSTNNDNGHVEALDDDINDNDDDDNDDNDDDDNDDNDGDDYEYTSVTNEIWSLKEQHAFHECMLVHGVCGHWNRYREFVKPKLNDKNDEACLEYLIACLWRIYEQQYIPICIPICVHKQLQQQQQDVLSIDDHYAYRRIKLPSQCGDSYDHIMLKQEIHIELMLRLALFDGISQAFRHRDYRTNIMKATTNMELPSWWLVGIHDDGLMKACLRYGLSSWNAVVSDTSLVFTGPIMKENPPSIDVIIRRLEYCIHLVLLSSHTQISKQQLIRMSSATSNHTDDGFSSTNGNNDNASSSPTVNTENDHVTATIIERRRPKKKPTRSLARLSQSVRLMSLGTIDTDPRFHSERYIYPVGYRSERIYPSLTGLGKTRYMSEVKRGDDGSPVFCITCSEGDGCEFVGNSTTNVWKKLEEQLNKHRRRSIALSRVDGDDRFGLNYPTVIRLIEKMENAHRCSAYVFRMIKSNEE